MNSSLNRVLPSSQDLNVTILIKGCERYVLVWTADHEDELRCTIGRWAANPELSLSWYDAAVLVARIQQRKERTNVKPGD